MKGTGSVQPKEIDREVTGSTFALSVWIGA